MSVVSKVKQFHQSNRRTTGCRSSKKNEVSMRSAQPSGFAYMKHRYKPVWNAGPISGDQETIETSFYRSLTYLGDLYNFKPPHNKYLIFPRNIAYDLGIAGKMLRKINRELCLFITHDEEKKTCVCTAEPFNVESKTLYYIPVRPLFRLLKEKHRGHTSQLLLSVFAYLYQVLQIPYYRNPSSFLYDCYNTIFEWLTNDEECDDKKWISKNKRLAKQSIDEGDAIMNHIKQPVHLQQFERRIQQFVARDAIDTKVLAIATSSQILLKEFPDNRLFHYIPENLLDPENDERIVAEHYISFFWDAEIEPVYSNLIEHVNGLFENCGGMDLPVGYQRFDKPHTNPSHDTRFPASVFNLVENLSEILIELYE